MSRTIRRGAPVWAGRPARRSRPNSKSPTRAWISLASSRCATCWVRWANRVSDGTIRAIWRPASRPADHPRTYEFGDTLNLDITATLSSAIQREGLDSAAEHRIFRSAGASMRISVFLRHRADAGLFAFDDSLWRGPVHSGEESRDGALASDSHPVSRETRCRWCCFTIRPKKFRYRNWRG